MSKQACKRLRRALSLPVNREPLPAFAWPGGYPLVYLCADGGVLCPACTNGNVREIDAITRDRDGWSGAWAVVSVFPHYEGPPEVCDHCGAEIESAYGDPEQE